MKKKDIDIPDSFSETILCFKSKIPYIPKDIVQILNPKTNRYIKIDRTTGTIIEYKSTKGPYKNITIVRK